MGICWDGGGGHGSLVGGGGRWLGGRDGGCGDSRVEGGNGGMLVDIIVVVEVRYSRVGYDCDSMAREVSEVDRLYIYVRK